MRKMKMGLVDMHNNAKITQRELLPIRSQIWICVSADTK